MSVTDIGHYRIHKIGRTAIRAVVDPDWNSANDEALLAELMELRGALKSGDKKWMTVSSYISLLEYARGFMP